MGDRRITDLTAQASFASGDCLAVDNSGNTETKKITAADAITTPINNVSQKVSGSADAYSSSKAYSVGDLVIYNNTVYECTTACSAASWSVNQSNFTATTLSSKLTSLNQALSNLGANKITKFTTTQNLTSGEGKLVLTGLSLTHARILGGYVTASNGYNYSLNSGTSYYMFANIKDDGSVLYLQSDWALITGANRTFHVIIGSD